jgi:hypothetical protein
MHRLFLLIMIALSTAITLAAGSAAWQTVVLARDGTPIDGADPAVAHAFYRALDRVLAGESGSLSEVVTDDFVDHSDTGTSGLSADALVERSQEFGQTYPGARLKIERVQVSGSTLIAVVKHDMPAPAQVAGVSLSPKPLGSSIEILRVQRGRVGERWATTPSSMQATTFEAASYGANSNATLSARLFRVTLSAGQELLWRGENPGLVMVEEGSVALTTIEHPADPGIPVRKTTTVAAGTAVAVPHGASMRPADDDEQRTQFLFFAIRYASSNATWTFRLNGGATSEPLWKSSAPFGLAGPWTITAGLVALPPECEAELGSLAGKTTILVAQGGPLHLTAEAGTLVRLDERYRMSAAGALSALPPGAAIQVSNTGSVVLGSSSDPVESVWLITLGPIDPEGGGAGLQPESPDHRDETQTAGPRI